MNTIKGRLSECILLACLICLISCNSSLDVVELPTFGEEQGVLDQLFDSRTQVYGVELLGDWLSITLKGSVIKINSNTFPYIYANGKGKWMVNEEELPDKKGETTSFPKLCISEDGYLLVNDQITHFSWTQSSIESIRTRNDWIWAVAQVDSFLCFYRSGIDNVIIPVIVEDNYIIPNYYFDLVVEKERQFESIVEDIPQELHNSYVFFTDAHWGCNQKHSPAIIKHVVDYTFIDVVLFGGDANTSWTETPQGTLDIGYQFHDAFSFLGPKLYCLFGNHDDNSTGQAALTERHLTEEQVFSYLQSQMTNAHYWDYYNFYFDDPTSKTRFICMDTGRFYEAAFMNALPKTAKFAIECLYSVPDGWHIVAASHIWSSLINFDTGELQERMSLRPIIEILENYNLRVRSSFTYGDIIIDYDFTGAGGVVEYCVGGHSHADGIVYSQKGLPLITVACDGQQEVAGGVPFTTGTIDEQCVTIVVNDYKNRKVHLFRIGRGSDCMVNMWNNNGNLT